MIIYRKDCLKTSFVCEIGEKSGRDTQIHFINGFNAFPVELLDFGRNFDDE
jgi:hypothetical protein